jgi:hypothetical protein
MSSSFGPRVSQCEFLIKVLSCMIFQKNYFSHSCAINAEYQKEDFNHRFFSIFSMNIFGGQDLKSPISNFMNFFFFFFFVEIYTLFSAAFNCLFFSIHEKITGYLF